MAIIWLPKRKYREHQDTAPGFCFLQKAPMNYVMVSIRKTFRGEKNIRSLDFRIACDTDGIVYVNGKLVINATNRAPADFFEGTRPVRDFYYTNGHADFPDGEKEIVLLSHVQLSSTRIYDFSSGHGGFLMNGNIVYEDGSVTPFESDESWEIRLEKSFTAPGVYDGSIEPGPWEKAEARNLKWNLLETRIPAMEEKEIVYENHFVIPAGKKRKFTRDFPLIYSSYYEVECLAGSNVRGSIHTFEVNDRKNGECKIVNENRFVFLRKESVRFMDLNSAGGYFLELENEGKEDAEIIIRFLHVHYPYKEIRSIETDNARLNDIFGKSLYAAVNCSQNIYLDSPKHCEPLASCSGDYNIESLVIACATGDYGLAKHVLRGYAMDLVNHRGKVANSDYALITVIWLWNIYLMTGDRELLKDCLKGSECAIRLYSSFIGERGIVDHPLSYIFIDWLAVDGYNLFSPPACLGQTVVNMFFYKALVSMSSIYMELGDERRSRRMASQAKRLKKAINVTLFDKEKGLYSEGLSEDYPEAGRSPAIPAGNGKTYFRKHGNILAVAYGLTGKKQSRAILKKLFTELSDSPVQPYFLHYFFEAVHSAGMDRKYARKILSLWTENVKKSDKGLPEGFYKPDPSYVFDYSHAWACSPYYSFIIASSGLRILEPGMRKITLSPDLLRLKKASYSIGTPYGFIEVRMEKGKEPFIQVPEGIDCQIS